jgi:myo-inositol-1(or 4)-monophosphatase
MNQSPAAELLTLRELALTAGRTLLARMDDIGPVTRKEATEIVTEVDGQVEGVIVAGIQAAFPGDAVEAEESGGRTGTSGRTWYIDPLDGTTNYAHGYPIFSVSLACADEQGLALAAVYAPYLDELYLARRGGGAVMERPQHGQRRVLAPRGPVQLTEALLATGFPYVRDDAVDRNTNRVRDFLRARCHGVRRGGSAAVDLAHVAAGKLDGYWETSLRPWDVAAGTLIAREAGAIVTDQAGHDEDLPYRNILAAAPGLHEAMREMLARSAGGPA